MTGANKMMEITINFLICILESWAVLLQRIDFMFFINKNYKINKSKICISISKICAYDCCVQQPADSLHLYLYVPYLQQLYGTGISSISWSPYPQVSHIWYLSDMSEISHLFFSLFVSSWSIGGIVQQYRGMSSSSCRLVGQQNSKFSKYPPHSYPLAAEILEKQKNDHHAVE